MKSIRSSAGDRHQGELRQGAESFSMEVCERFPILQKVDREMPVDWRPPVVTDLDGDGLEEIVVVDAGIFW